MSNMSMTFPNDLPETKVVGPYSQWPRPKSRKVKAVAKFVSVAAAGGAVVHCLPYYLT